MIDLLRPIIGIENRSPQEVFDIMCDRIRHAGKALAFKCQVDRKGICKASADDCDALCPVRNGFGK